MRLLRLEITGFKSFQDRTVISFPPGITAVVGPNGCGKSNIVDALRWVMGEQSVKQLRGKSMEDLIFAGADGKQPLNLAEVSLLVENTSGPAPDAPMSVYSEIMVTRRLYRSGESAYLINKQPCRLKDITTLFLGSGSGKHSFAVIQQGNIGALTDATPEERRFFIEDAADITKFKDKKKETLSRIKTTRENLLRISDIIAELKRQINALERQVVKAKKYKEYRARLKFLDIALAIRQFDHLSAKIIEKSTEMDTLRQSDRVLSEKLEELDSRIDLITRRASDMKSVLSGLSQNRFETQRAMDRKENDLHHLDREAERLIQEIADISKKTADVNQRNKSLELEIAETESSHTGIDEEIQSRENELTLENSRLESLRSQQRAIDQNRRLLNQAHMVHSGNEAKTGSVLQHAELRREDILRRLKRMDEDILESAKKAREAETTRKDVAYRLEEIRTDVSALTQEKDRLARDITAFKKNRDDLRNALKSVEIDLSARLSKYQTLKKIHDSYGWYKDGVRAVMNRFDSLNDSRNLGMFADRVTPEAGYEKAAEALLNDALQSVVVDSRATVQEQIGFLRQEKQGQCGFIPTDPVLPPPAPWIPDGLSLLTEHLAFHPDDAPLVSAVACGALVADDLDTAFTALEGRSPGVTVVTLAGDIIHPGGIIVGGDKDNTVSVFMKKRELEELERSVTEVRGEQTRLKEAFDRAEETIQAGIRDEAALQIDLNGAISDRNVLEKELLMAEEQSRQIGRRREILLLEQEQLEGESDDVERDIERNKTLIEAIREDIRQSESKLRESAEQLQNLTDAIERQNAVMVEMKVTLGGLRTRSENFHHTLNRMKEYLKEGLARSVRLNSEFTEKEDKKNDLARMKVQYTDEREELARQLNTLSDAIATGETDLSSIEKELTEKENARNEFQTGRDNGLEQIRTLELELSGLRITRENLTTRIQEKYHQQINQYKLEFESSEENRTDAEALDTDEAEKEIDDLNQRIRQLGDVNLGAIAEFEELKTRYDFLEKQQADLVKSLEDLETIIDRINAVSQERFMETFNAVNEKLATLFPTLFEGGTAQMILTDPGNPLETGVELMIQPPGKKFTRLSLLSGGEKALSAIAFVFSIFLIKPASFCIMDEIDAPLDDANVVRFNNMVKHIGEQSQILMITHNKLTMEFADILFGVTMEKKGVSKIVSVSLSREEDTEPAEYATGDFF